MIRKVLDNMTGARRLDPDHNNDRELRYKYDEEVKSLKSGSVPIALMALFAVMLLFMGVLLVIDAYIKWGWFAVLVFPGIPLVALLWWYGVYRFLKRHLDARFAEAILIRGGQK